MELTNRDQSANKTKRSITTEQFVEFVEQNFSKMESKNHKPSKIEKAKLDESEPKKSERSLQAQDYIKNDLDNESLATK